MSFRRKPNEVVRGSQSQLLRFFQNDKIVVLLTKRDLKRKSLALMVVEIPQQAMGKQGARNCNGQQVPGS